MYVREMPEELSVRVFESVERVIIAKCDNLPLVGGDYTVPGALRSLADCIEAYYKEYE